MTLRNLRIVVSILLLLNLLQGVALARPRIQIARLVKLPEEKLLHSFGVPAHIEHVPDLQGFEAETVVVDFSWGRISYLKFLRTCQIRPLELSYRLEPSAKTYALALARLGLKTKLPPAKSAEGGYEWLTKTWSGTSLRSVIVSATLDKVDVKF